MALDRFVIMRLVTWLALVVIVAFIIYGYLNPPVKELRTEVIINATEDRVWGVLTDFEAYPEWNPFIRSIRGRLAPGSELEVSIVLPGGRSTTFSPEVTSVEVNRGFTWLGRLWVRDIYDGENIFEISPQGDGKVLFAHNEVFRGVLVPVYADRLDTDYRKAFDDMNSALKARVEAGA